MADDDRIRSPAEAKKAVRASLRTIAALIKVYDDGHYETARDIATVLNRLITDELVQTRLRRQLKFISFSFPLNPKNLVMQYLASAIETHIEKPDEGDPTITVTHVPLLDEGQSAGSDPNILVFNEWWNEPVLIWGASDGPMIPIEESMQVPFDERKRISRLDVVGIIRNKTGAHFDRIVDADSREMEDPLFRSLDVVLTSDSGESVRFSYLDTPEAYIFKNSRAQAILRHIAFEIIKSAATWEFSS